MTISNWLELFLMFFCFSGLIGLHVLAAKKLTSIDGLGEVHTVKEADGKNIIDI